MSNLDFMLNGFKDDEFNPVNSFSDMDKDLPTKLVSIYEIEYNPLNDQGDTEEELQEFAEVIREEGQIRSPLNVYRTLDGSKKYRLLGGDRRLHALLINAEKYEDAQRMVPVIIEKRPDNEIIEELKILELNEHRALTPERERKLVGRYLKIYRALEETGNKPQGQVRKWIASRMNIGEKKAEKYIHDIEGYQRQRKNQDSEKRIISTEEKKKQKQVIKSISQDMDRKVKVTNSTIVFEYNPNDLTDFYTLLNVLGFNDKGERV